MMHQLFLFVVFPVVPTFPFCSRVSSRPRHALSVDADGTDGTEVRHRHALRLLGKPGLPGALGCLGLDVAASQGPVGRPPTARLS